MNIKIPTLTGLQVQIVPINTVIKTEAGDVTVNDQFSATDGNSIWMTEKSFQEIKNHKECTNGAWDAEALIPSQSVIDTWPKLQRKAVTGQDIAKYLEKAKTALEYVP
ncbi:hypothetical protein ACINWC743_1555 [Acinetobacter sp. WC-743]|uniref:hypothetical protein n=1 Tax=Acinetobacter sp. WC-743 TaxID=903945 RepID=UPI0002AE7FE3|nr:hypothetical protein [Acinetobacter sp. WC-743]ELW82015.1 hypothetical protein ACINWC743_1555 [Acinetobacter sp. WC-743]